MKKKIGLVLIGIIVVVGGVIGYQAYSESQQPIEYAVHLPTKADIKEVLAEDGIIESSKIHTYYADGMSKVDRVFVEVGDRVEKGTLLLTYKNNLDLELKRIDQEIAALEATYEEITSSVDFEETNAILLQKAELQRQLDDANRTLENVTILYEEGISPKTEFDQATLAVSQLEGQIDILNNEYNLLVKGVSSSVKEQYLAQIEGLLVSKSLVEVQQEDYEVYANMAGIITEQNIFDGSQPFAGTLMIEVQQRDERIAVIDFLVDDVMKVSEGSEVVIKNEETDLLINDLRVTKIYPKADSTVSELGIEQKRVRVEVELPSDYKGLTIGQDITAEVIVQTKEDVILIPKDVVYELEGKDMVTKLVGETLIEEQVILGIDDGHFYEVISGVDVSDQLVVE